MPNAIQGYAFEFRNGSVFTPDGKCADDMTAQDVARANEETERKEIEWLKTGPEKAFLYCSRETVHTWSGTVIDPYPVFGDRKHVGFGYGTYRRAVTCRIFGVLYHGWYMESSGDYCRLRRAKKQ